MGEGSKERRSWYVEGIIEDKYYLFIICFCKNFVRDNIEGCFFILEFRRYYSRDKFGEKSLFL